MAPAASTSAKCQLIRRTENPESASVEVLRVALAARVLGKSSGGAAVGRGSGRLIVISLPLGSFCCFFSLRFAIRCLGGSVDRSVARRNPKAEAQKGQPVARAELVLEPAPSK